ncbi:hypothetical protein [Variovorax sp. WS11]|uniref:hypothetical protein n=1 Tax=Variovorax sp. WS11 TaxID=1105204 RepID=UPI0013DB8D1B|nr:hypothetical protein [Variovorax sp. WS11]NDZ16694.1 hypothetical protein [Variovorax sp. WS11]
MIIEDHPFVAEATKALIAKSHPELSARVCDAAAPALSLLLDPDRCWHRVLLDLAWISTRSSSPNAGLGLSPPDYADMRRE